MKITFTKEFKDMLESIGQSFCSIGMLTMLCGGFLTMGDNFTGALKVMLVGLVVIIAGVLLNGGLPE